MNISDTVATFDIDSNTSMVGGLRSKMKVKFDETIKLVPSHRHRLVLTYCKLINTVRNITAALGNNTLRYTIDNTAVPIVWNVVTIEDGIYNDISSIQNNINLAIENNAHIYTDPVTNEDHYPFTLIGVASTSKVVTWINTQYNNGVNLHPDKITVDLTNNSTSSLYLTLGYLIGEAIIDGSVIIYQIPTNSADLYDSQFSIKCSGISSNIDGHAGGNVLFRGNFCGDAGGYLFLTEKVNNIFADMKSNYDEITTFDIDLVDRNNVNLVFADNSTDSNILMRFSIIDIDRTSETNALLAELVQKTTKR